MNLNIDFKKDIFEKGKTFLLNPKNAFDNEAKSDVISGLKYAVIWLFIMSLLSAIVFALFGDIITASMMSLWLPESVAPAVTGSSILSSFFASWIGGIIGLLFVGLWLHLWAYILGARMKVENTLKTVFYGNTPNYVLGWIPFINFIAMIWTLALYIIGLTKLQKLSTGRAIITLAIAVLIPGLIMLALFISLLSVIGEFPPGFAY